MEVVSMKYNNPLRLLLVQMVQVEGCRSWTMPSTPTMGANNNNNNNNNNAEVAIVIFSGTQQQLVIEQVSLTTWFFLCSFLLSSLRRRPVVSIFSFCDLLWIFASKTNDATTNCRSVVGYLVVGINDSSVDASRTKQGQRRREQRQRFHHCHRIVITILIIAMSIIITSCCCKLFSHPALLSITSYCCNSIPFWAKVAIVLPKLHVKQCPFRRLRNADTAALQKYRKPGKLPLYFWGIILTVPSAKYV